jgi:hypothetical protein
MWKSCGNPLFRKAEEEKIHEDTAVCTRIRHQFVSNLFSVNYELFENNGVADFAAARGDGP